MLVSPRVAALFSPYQPQGRPLTLSTLTALASHPHPNPLCDLEKQHTFYQHLVVPLHLPPNPCSLGDPPHHSFYSQRQLALACPSSPITYDHHIMLSSGPPKTSSQRDFIAKILPPRRCGRHYHCYVYSPLALTLPRLTLLLILHKYTSDFLSKDLAQPVCGQERNARESTLLGDGQNWVDKFLSFFTPWNGQL